MERYEGYSEFKIEKRYLKVDGKVVQKFCVIGMDPEFEAEGEIEEFERFDSYSEAEQYILTMLNA